MSGRYHDAVLRAGADVRIWLFVSAPIIHATRGDAICTSILRDARRGLLGSPHTFDERPTAAQRHIGTAAGCQVGYSLNCQ